jgi:HlyD family secretion protein
MGRLEALLERQFESERAKAEAQLAQAEEKTALARRRQARDVRVAELELEGARDEQTRLKGLVSRGAASPSELVKATLRVQEAQEQLAKARLPVEESEVEVARRALASVPREHAVKRNELETRRATRRGEVDAARIELAKLELQRQQAVLRAPVAGVVTAGDVKVGGILEQGRPVLEVAEQKGFRFEAAVPSEDVGELKVGMPVRIKLDAFDYQKYGTVDGVVCFIAPDSGVPEGQHAVMHVVRVEVRGDEVGRGELRGRVKLGMAGQAEVITGQESLLMLLVKKIRRTISLG